MSETPKNADRDSLRTDLFKRKKFKSKTVDLFGTTIELRQPSIGQISEMDETTDTQTALVKTLVQYAYVPGTDTRVFEDADKDVILSWPVGPWVRDLNEAIAELTTIDVQDAEKN